MEVGRVARVNYGSQEGELAVIVDIINDHRVLVDGEHIKRQVIPIKRLQLTRLTVPVGRGSRTGAVRAVLSKEGLAKKWADSHNGKLNAQRVRRAKLNDFERFKVTILRKRVRSPINPAVEAPEGPPRSRHQEARREEDEQEGRQEVSDAPLFKR